MRAGDRDYAGTLIASTFEEKVMFVRMLIGELQWRKQKTVMELSTLWRMSTMDVWKVYRAAEQRIHEELSTSGTSLAATILDQIQFVTASAMEKTKAIVLQGEGGSCVEMVPDPDHKAAIAGLKLAVEIIRPPKRDKGVIVDYSELKLEELFALARQHLLPMRQEASETKAITEGSAQVPDTATGAEGHGDKEASPRARRGRKAGARSPGNPRDNGE